MIHIAAGGYGGMFIIDVSDPEEPRVINRLKLGNVKKVHSYRSFIFAVTENDIKILSVFDPSEPYLVKELNVGRAVKDSHMKGNFVYILTDESLAVADVSIPTNPVVLGKMKIEGKAVYAVSNRVYITSSSGDVMIINASNPKDPEVLGNLALGEDIRGIHGISENRMFFLTPGNLIIADLSDPEKFQILARLNLHNGLALHAGDPERVYVIDSSDMIVVDTTFPERPEIFSRENIGIHASDMVIFQNYAYIVGMEDGLLIVDISDPTGPEALKHLKLSGYADGIFVNFDYIYVASFLGSEITIFEKSANLEIVGKLETNAFDLYVSGEYAYVAAGSDGVLVVDISDPENPDTVGRFKFDGVIRDIYVSENYAYTAADEGLLALDISNPTSPEMIGFIEEIPVHSISAADDFTAGRRYIVAAGEEGLLIVDVSIPEDPKFYGLLRMKNPRKVHALWNYAYIASGEDGLVVVDVPRLEIAGKVPVGGNAIGVHVVGNYAYVVVDDKELAVVDVSDPSDLKIVKRLKVDFVSSGVYGRLDYVDMHSFGSYLYIAAGENGPVVIDISDPKNPRVVNDRVWMPLTSVSVIG